MENMGRFSSAAKKARRSGFRVVRGKKIGTGE
jgi:hypothetical protein